MQSDPITLPDSHTQGEWIEDLRKQGKTIEDIAREQQERGPESGGTFTPAIESQPADDGDAGIQPQDNSQ